MSDEISTEKGRGGVMKKDAFYADVRTRKNWQAMRFTKRSFRWKRKAEA